MSNLFTMSTLSDVLARLAAHSASYIAAEECDQQEDEEQYVLLEFDGVTVPAKQAHAAFMSALGFAYANVISADAYIDGMSETA